MNKTILLLIPLLFLACQNEESARSVEEPVQVPVVAEETIAMAEHERLLGEAEAATEAMARELTHQVRSFETAFKAKEEEVESLEVKVLELTASLEAYKKQARDSKLSLNELRKLGSAEYKVIYERAKTVDNEAAIALYEEFIEQFPDSPIAGKARAQLRKHLTERKILENRKDATTLRTWEIKLKGEGMFVREVPAAKLFELIGRNPDSSKRGSSSEYRQFTYVWRDYVLGKGGEYYDLLIHRTNDKVDRVSFEE
ncbi:MAG: hypothetical protein HN531_01995 [Opitutae bacterium]|nr:hypothetical protein [Opitutae bacterium]